MVGFADHSEISILKHVKCFRIETVLTIEQAAKDLCRIYNIDINLSDNSGKTVSRDERLQIILERDLYTIRDFENELTAIKRQNLSIEERARQINTSVIKLSVSKKKLIDF